MTSDGLAHGQLDGEPIHVGDTAVFKAEVLRSVAGVGALLKIFSKTDEMQIWVAEDHLLHSSMAELTPEPPDGTWLLAHDADGMPKIFHRNDAEGHFDPGRRHQQHWFDVVNGEWIDWPTACERGATLGNRRRMVVLADGQTDLDIAVLDAAVTACWLHGDWRALTGRMGENEREAAAAAVERHQERVNPYASAEPTTGLRWWQE